MAVKQTLISIVIQYHILLERYARGITRNKEIASAIAKLALEQYYQNRDQIAAHQARKQLKNYTLVLCQFWLKHQTPVANPATHSFKSSEPPTHP